MRKSHARTLILGVGNILLRDEGIGVRIIERLKQRQFPEDVELVDGGTAGADLIDILSDRHTVFIVDSAQSNAIPGTLLKFSTENCTPQEVSSLSLHELDIPQTLAMTRLLGCAPEKVVIFGIVPETIAPGLELSQTLKQKLPFYINAIYQELALPI